MTRVARRMAFAGLSLEILLAACGSRGNRDVLQLECRGDEVVDAQPVKRSVNRIYRLDPQASALENWDSQAGRFVRWGTGRVSIDRRFAAYGGEVRSMNQDIRVKKELEFNRSTKKILDRIEGSWGSVAAFSGTCEERYGPDDHSASAS